MVEIQVTKRPEKASPHIPLRTPYRTSYSNLEKLSETSNKGEKRTNIIREWRKNHRQA
jgi:hypothetical protein